MKKILIYLTLVVSLLACGEKYVQPEAAPAAISFAVPEVIQAKSVLIENETQLATGAGELGYAVFASRYISSADGEMVDHQKFMDDVKVYSTDGGATWRYSGTYYWAPGAVHKFFAVYPYHDKSIDTYDLGISYAINEEVHALQVTGKHKEGSKTYICTGTDTNGKNLCPDILFGVEKYSEPYNVGENRKPINFQLSHALSAVSFRFRNASEYPVVKIAPQAISGFFNASEYVRLSEDGAFWAKNPIVLSEHSFAVPGFNVTASQSSEKIAAGSYYTPVGNYWFTSLMIPQDFGAQSVSPYFTFEVTMENSESKTYTINFKDYAVHDEAVNAYSYLPGHHYVYTFNVTASKIMCDVSIVPWIEDEPIHLN